jgi:hypothetical protein
VSAQSEWEYLQGRLGSPIIYRGDRDQKTLIRQGLAYVCDGKLYARTFLGVAQRYDAYLRAAKAIQKRMDKEYGTRNNPWTYRTQHFEATGVMP